MSSTQDRRAEIDAKRRRIQEMREKNKLKMERLMRQSTSNLPTMDMVQAEAEPTAEHVDIPAVPKPPSKPESTEPPSRASEPAQQLAQFSKVILDQAPDQPTTPAAQLFTYPKETQTETDQPDVLTPLSPVRPHPAPSTPGPVSTEPVPEDQSTRVLSEHSAELVQADPLFKSFFSAAGGTMERLLGANELLPRLVPLTDGHTLTAGDQDAAVEVVLVHDPPAKFAGTPVAALGPSSARPELLAAAYPVHGTGLSGTGGVVVYSTVLHQRPEAVLEAVAAPSTVFMPSWAPHLVLAGSPGGALMAWDMRTGTYHDAISHSESGVVGLGLSSLDHHPAMVMATADGTLGWWTLKVLTKPQHRHALPARAGATWDVTALHSTPTDTIMGTVRGGLVRHPVTDAATDGQRPLSPVRSIVQATVAGEVVYCTITTDAGLTIWSSDLEELHTIDTGGFVSDIVAVPGQGAVVAAVEGHLLLIDLASTKITRVALGSVIDAAFDPTVLTWITGGGRRLLAVGSEDGRLAYLHLDDIAATDKPVWRQDK